MFVTWALTSAIAWRKKGKYEAFFRQARAMTKFSQFVRSHLATRQTQTADHPDANLLLAFTEQNLSRRERAGILDHLVGCPECREVVALTSGLSPHESSFSPAPARRGFRWWDWRLASSAAVVCLVIVTVWRPLFKSSPQPTSPSKPITIGGRRSVVPPPLVSKTMEREVTKQETRRTKRKPAPPRQPAELAGSSPTLSLPEPADEAAKVNDTIVIAAQQAVASAALSNLAPPPRQSGPARPTAQHKAFTSNSMFSDGVSASHSAAAARTSMGPPPRQEKSLWSLDRPTADGTVQKSDDNGKTWRTIHVDDRTPLFALFASESNVWVGGADGKLFRSFDGGVRWIPIRVSDDDMRLTSAITGIEASDENSVKLRTKSGGIWVTGDGGLHWSRAL
jgi:hypothetical protein